MKTGGKTLEGNRARGEAARLKSTRSAFIKLPQTISDILDLIWCVFGHSSFKFDPISFGFFADYLYGSHLYYHDSP